MPNRAPGSHAWIISALQVPSLQALLPTGHPASFFSQEPNSNLATLLVCNLMGSPLPTAGADIRLITTSTLKTQPHLKLQIPIIYHDGGQTPYPMKTSFPDLSPTPYHPVKLSAPRNISITFSTAHNCVPHSTGAPATGSFVSQSPQCYVVWATACSGNT